MKTGSPTVTTVDDRIHALRGSRVLLDGDLAMLYGVSTKVLLQAVRRNRRRFPSDFMFRLNNHELTNLRSQIVTSSLRRKHGGRRYLPWAFTEQGVGNAVQCAAQFGSNRREHRDHARVRTTIRSLVDTIRRILETPPPPKKRPIGFVPIE